MTDRYGRTPEQRHAEYLKYKDKSRDKRKAYYLANRDQILEKSKARYRANPDPMKARARDWHSQHVGWRHGVGPGDRQARLDYQHGLCWFCDMPLFIDEATVDHDHDHCPGEVGCKECVRSLVHTNCNRAEGIARRLYENGSRAEWVVDLMDRASRSPWWMIQFGRTGVEWVNLGITNEMVWGERAA